jgi:plastocyanin
MRTLPIALTVLLFAAVPAVAQARNVKVADDYFVRSSGVATVTVTKGTTVKWVWRGNRQHNVTVQKGPQRFQSALKTRGSFKRRMTRKGTYTIICTIHAPDMRMKLKVT